MNLAHIRESRAERSLREVSILALSHIYSCPTCVLCSIITVGYIYTTDLHLKIIVLVV